MRGFLTLCAIQADDFPYLQNSGQGTFSGNVLSNTLQDDYSQIERACWLMSVWVRCELAERSLGIDEGIVRTYGSGPQWHREKFVLESAMLLNKNA